MVCIYCGEDTRVINSRYQKRLNSVWRRRRCVRCGSTITTEERPRYDATLMVKGQSGDLQAFSPEKLLISLYQSLAYRETAIEDATALCKTVIARLRQHSANAVIDRDTLIKETRAILARFDSLASTHYAAYHRTEV